MKLYSTAALLLGLTLTSANAAIAMTYDSHLQSPYPASPATEPSPTAYIYPAQGTLTSGYGWRWGRMHNGIDIAAPEGTPIVAAAAGTVITAHWNNGGYGNLIEIQHSDSRTTLYAHNSKILVKVGDQVEQGQTIALMGSTGYSTGPHCHFEIHTPEHKAVDPLAYLPAHTVASMYYKPRKG